VADVECSGHATLVTRHGVLVAAIVPVAEEKLDEAARAKLLDALRLATGDADPDLT
jgi:antitoxin (DNA-binding transcriptional repressor) of toxin-antitoxin stability system